MSLTKQDLQAIQHMIDSSEKRLSGRLDSLQQRVNDFEHRTLERFDELEATIVRRIDAFDDVFSRQVAEGFSEVHGKIDALTRQGPSWTFD